MALKDHPIIVFDSGMGGISVLKEMVRIMPEEDFIYFGDSANAPYGIRSLQEVRRLTVDHIRYFIEEKSVKAVAIACNTATSAAVRYLRKTWPDIPLVGVEPAIKPAVEASSSPRILVMATPMTLREKKFLDLESCYENQAKIYPLPCPGLMDFVEKGILSGNELEARLHELMDPYLDRNLTGIVLGCTHYPFVRQTIQKVAGSQIPIYDGSLGTAKELSRRIRAAGLARPADHRGSVTFLNSSDHPQVLSLMEFLFHSESTSD